MRVAIYARVSTDRGEQNPAVQIEALLKWLRERGDEPARVFTDSLSGSVRERPELDMLLRLVAQGAFDAVAIVKLDRMARSTRHLLDLAEFLKDHDVDLLVKDQQIDTSTPMGRFMFTVLAAVAEFERDLIRERTVAGLEHARNNGKVLGRPRVEKRRANALGRAVADVVNDGVPVRASAKRHHISRTTLQRYVDQERSKNAGNGEDGRRAQE